MKRHRLTNEPLGQGKTTGITGSIAVDLETLMDHYLRLQHDLSSAYERRPWPSVLIDQLADRLSATEREIAVAANEWQADGHLDFPGVEYLNLSMVARQAEGHG